MRVRSSLGEYMTRRLLGVSGTDPVFPKVRLGLDRIELDEHALLCI